MKTHARSMSLAITWRVVATFVTILLMFVFTGSLVISVGVGSLECILKIRNKEVHFNKDY